MGKSPSPEKIGRYAVLKELGRGGMGVVWRGKDSFIGREVAIKQLLDATPDLRKRFLDEARSGVLNHQNIVTVYDFGEQDDNPYIVMEFLCGESLDRILKGDRPLSLVEKLEIVRQVCEGLDYAHKKGVVHRDIKPANIMVQPDGHIKIVDFGIARLESATRQTQTGGVVGTSHYISPERWKGEPHDGRTDIWACGVMLYLMLTGRLPFDGEDYSVLNKVVNEPFEPLSNILTNYPNELDHVLDRALAKNPEERYPSANQMAADIRGINERSKLSPVNDALTGLIGIIAPHKVTAALPILRSLQYCQPENPHLERLLGEVEEIYRQARSDKLKELIQGGDGRAHEQNYGEALYLYKLAAEIDGANDELIQKINLTRKLGEEADKAEEADNAEVDNAQHSRFPRPPRLTWRITQHELRGGSPLHVDQANWVGNSVESGKEIRWRRPAFPVSPEGLLTKTLSGPPQVQPIASVATKEDAVTPPLYSATRLHREKKILMALVLSGSALWLGHGRYSTTVPPIHPSTLNSGNDSTTRIPAALPQPPSTVSALVPTRRLQYTDSVEPRKQKVRKPKNEDPNWAGLISKPADAASEHRFLIIVRDPKTDRATRSDIVPATPPQQQTQEPLPNPTSRSLPPSVMPREPKY